MRTKTTTREQTWNKEKNYPLKLFLYENGYEDIYEKIKKIEFSKVITHGKQLTDDPQMIEKINTFLCEKKNKQKSDSIL